MGNLRKKAWGGRFSKKSNPLLESFNASISFDQRLAIFDIQGSVAHARMLKKISLLTEEELAKILQGLEAVQSEIQNGKFAFAIEDEDIHMAIEKRLIQKIGPVGGKLHTARSRNDQVALDLRLYCVKNGNEIHEKIKGLQKVLVDLAEGSGMVPMPGYTHLQRAQPILFAHHLMAYFEMLKRDGERLAQAIYRTNFSPLGSGALAGSPYPLDREYVAGLLGMNGITQNSLDAVSDRDFVVEIVFCLSLLMTHLSRLCEELILWSTSEFSFVELPEEFCTGSSMMPQKINPDVPELIRGKTGRVVGHLMGLFLMLKGLPLAYNKDLQEDKEALFDAMDTASQALEILSAMIPGMKINSDKMEEALKEGGLLATDLADYLVTKGLPFREAHQIVGNLILEGQKKRVPLEAFELSTLKKYSKLFEEDATSWLSIKSAINRRASVGGTAMNEVRRQIKQARRVL